MNDPLDEAIRKIKENPSASFDGEEISKKQFAVLILFCTAVCALIYWATTKIP